MTKTDRDRLAHSERQLSENEGRKSTRIYLMRDPVSGAHKIGVSKNPESRLIQIQKEVPSAELVSHWCGLERHESILHGFFIKKRARGEWFHLNGEDIAFINEFFSTNK